MYFTWQGSKSWQPDHENVSKHCKGEWIYCQGKQLYSFLLPFSVGFYSLRKDFGWLFEFNDPLRQYFSLYWVVSQREGERREMIDERKNVQTTPPAPTASAVALALLQSKLVGRPSTESLPSTIAPPDHPRKILEWILSFKSRPLFGCAVSS